MGWFLPGKPSGRRQGGRKGGKKPSLSLGQRVRLGLNVSAAVVLVGAVTVGWYVGEDWLGRQVGADRRAPQVQVVLMDRPAWLDEPRSQAIVELVRQALSGDPLDRGALERAYEQLSANPWVEQVDRLVRRPGGRVEVYARYRRPAALVAGRDGYHLVDWKGCRLPGVYPFEQLPQLGLVAILGAASAPPPVGRPWPGRDVSAGLKLLGLLAGQPFAGQVKAIDVSNYDGQIDPNKPQLRLLTDRGTVRWGRAPGEEGVYEPPAERKIRMLLEVAADPRWKGRIDAGGQVVDVFSDTPMIHRAVEASGPGMPPR